jgi:nucleoid-associated protein YgaU
MIRMMLIYAVLFFAAAGALWLGPSSTPGATDVAKTEVPQVPQPVIDVSPAAPVAAPVVEVPVAIAAAAPTPAPATPVGVEAPVIVAAPAPVPDVPPALLPAQTSVPQDVAALVARSFEKSFDGAGNSSGAIDLEPMLDDVPGSVRAPDGTRILASALLRRPDAPISGLPTPEVPASVVAPAPVAVAPQRATPPVQVSTRPQPAPEVLRRADAPATSDEADEEVGLSLASVIATLRAQSALEAEVRNVRTVSANPGAGPIASSDAPRTYVVQPGDSLLTIARTFYGESDAFRQIFDANRDQLSSIDTVQAGQILRLP